MVRTNLTISIDSDIRDKSKKYLAQEGAHLSTFIESKLKELIDEYESEEDREAQEESEGE
jgi:hypothetical protein